MGVLVYLVLSVFFQHYVYADFYAKSTGVINADISNFDDIVASTENEVVMVEFYAPWCGHCKQLQPEYAKLAKSLKNIVKVVAIDASDDKNRPIAQKYGVEGFPSLKVHIGTDPAIDYNGQRDMKSMKQFLLENLPSFVTRITSKNLQKFLNQNKQIPRSLIFSKKGDTSATVKRFSALLKGHISIGNVAKKDSKAIAKKYEISTKHSSVLLIFPANETENARMFQGNTKSFKEVQAWMYSFAPSLEIDDSDSLPKLLDQSCYIEKCEKKGLCVILIGGEDESDYQKIHTILKEIQETSDDSSLFAFSQMTASEGSNYEWIQSLFGNMDTYYSNVVVFAPQKKRYAHYVGSVTHNALKGFISGILTGKTRTTPIASSEVQSLPTETEYCKPKPKPKKKAKKKAKQQQQQPPKSGPGGGSPFIVSVTNDNWKQVLFGNNQAVVLEFYAPWCGHCKSLAPEFAKAATALKGMVLFGTVDCDNEANKPLCGQFQIKGFPSIKIFPSGMERKQKNGAKDYQGPRTSKGLEKAAIDTLYSTKVPLLKSSEDYNEFIANQGPKLKILLISKKKKPPTLLRALAATFDEISFVMVSFEQTPDLVNSLDVSPDSLPIIFAYEQSLNQNIAYEGEKTFIKISQWIVGFIQTQQNGKDEL